MRPRSCWNAEYASVNFANRGPGYRLSGWKQDICRTRHPTLYRTISKVNSSEEVKTNRQGRERNANQYQVRERAALNTELHDFVATLDKVDVVVEKVTQLIWLILDNLACWKSEIQSAAAQA